MKAKLSVLAALFCSFNLQAYSNFIENPYTLYPPGCATLPDLQTALYGDNAVMVFDGEITLPNALDSTEELPVDLNVYRVGCADSSRSVVLLEFTIPDQMSPTDTFYRVPGVRVGYDGEYFPGGNGMSLSREPNSWGGGELTGSSEVFGGSTPGTMDGYDRRWIFVLDNSFPPQLNDGGEVMTPTNYNQYLTLWIERLHSDWWTMEIGRTADLLKANPRIPLSGRLSGNWVIDGAADQGFVIAISELAPDSVPAPEDLQDSPLLMFLSWYTYDANGNKLWLTGSSEFAMGDTEVNIPIEKVTHGEFMGNKTADRAVVGSVTITGNNCNGLNFKYDLGGLGLGSGTKHLQHLFSLETAGYVCRDMEARMATK